MFRQRFSCLNLPQHQFNDTFRLWLSDLDIARPFLLDADCEEYFVIGQNAFSFIVRMEDRSYHSVPAQGLDNYLGLLNNVKVYGNALSKSDNKKAFDLHDNDIEYRIEYKC